jgi:hypothetical protein
VVAHLAKEGFEKHFSGIVLEEPRETTVSVKGTCVRDEIKEHGDF